MIPLNEAKLILFNAQTTGSRPALVDAYEKWLVEKNGAIPAPLRDMEYEFLTAKGYKGHVHEMLYQWFGDLGHNQGQLNERWLSFCLAGGNPGVSQELSVHERLRQLCRQAGFLVALFAIADAFTYNIRAWFKFQFDFSNFWGF